MNRIKKLIKGTFIFRLYKLLGENTDSQRYRNSFATFGATSKIINPFIITQRENIYIGSNVRIHDNARIQIVYAQEKEEKPIIKINDNCGLGYNLTILAGADVIIEKNVAIASNVFISSGNHGINPEINIAYGEQIYTGKEVIVREGVWIGEKVCIMSGVIIGKKSIIGAGSIVTKDIPDYCMAVGNPAKVIKKYNFKNHEWERV